MNESLEITVRHKTSKRRLPINSFTTSGMVLNNEIGTLPRAVRLLLAPLGARTQARIDWVLRRRGVRALELKLCAQDGNLLVRGADEAGLPEGRYSLRLDIEDLKSQAQQVDLSDGEVRKPIAVEVADDQRRVKLNAKMDGEIRRLLALDDCLLDDCALPQWLARDEVRAKRKACLLNILTKLRCAPLVSDPLSRHVRRIFYCDVDRIYMEVDGSMLQRVKDLAADPARPFYSEGPPAHPAHKRLLAAIPEPEGYTLDSYREEGHPSMQIVFAVPPANSGRPLFAECDIDLGNPLQDVAGLLVHIPEVVGGARTDHLAMWPKLMEGKTGSYLPYTVA